MEHQKPLRSIEMTMVPDSVLQPQLVNFTVLLEQPALPMRGLGLFSEEKKTQMF